MQGCKSDQVLLPGLLRGADVWKILLSSFLSPSSIWLIIVSFLKERVGSGAIPSPHSVAHCEGKERLQELISAAQDLSAPTAIRKQGAARHHTTTTTLPSLFTSKIASPSPPYIACLVLDHIGAGLSYLGILNFTLY